MTQKASALPIARNPPATLSLTFTGRTRPFSSVVVKRYVRSLHKPQQPVF